MNKKIPSMVAISIIVLCAVIVGIVLILVCLKMKDTTSAIPSGKESGELLGKVYEGLTREEIENAEYETCWRPEIGKFRLTGGTYSDEENDFSIETYKLYDMDVPSQINFGDLNNDGNKDAAVILRSAGEDRDNYEIAIFLNVDGEPSYFGCKKLENASHTLSVAIQPEIVNVHVVVFDSEVAYKKNSIIMRYRLSKGKIVDIAGTEVSDWTYKNDKYGYKLEFSGSAILLNDGEEGITVDLPSGKEGMSQWFSIDVRSECFYSEEEVEGLTEINGTEFKIISYIDGGTQSSGYVEEYITTIEDGKCLSIFLKSSGSRYSENPFHEIFNKEEDLKVLREIVQTFEFIKEDEISDWEIYRNQEYGFEVKHPSFSKQEIEKPGYLTLSLSENSVVPFFMVVAEKNVGSLETFVLDKEDSLGPNSVNKGIGDNGFINLKEAYEDKTLLGLSAKELKLQFPAGGEPFGIRTYVVNNNVGYIIQAYSYALDEYSFIQDKDFFESYYKILSTFRFREGNEVSDWKTHKYGVEAYDDVAGYEFEFKYPDIITISRDLGPWLDMIHSVPLEHKDLCDGRGDAPSLKELVDFEINIFVSNIDLIHAMCNAPYDYDVDCSDYVVDNKVVTIPGYVDRVIIGSLDGYRITGGAEGCGRHEYYFSLSPEVTLVIWRSFRPELNPRISTLAEEYLKIPGVISPEEEEEIFNRMFSSFKFTQ